MANKTYAIVDINSFLKQNVETLLFASILEKKFNNLTILDLNQYDENQLLSERSKWQKQAEILSASIFSNTSYQILAKASYDQNKVINLAKSYKTKSDILLINSCYNHQKLNSEFFKLADQIIIFADINKNIVRNVINFYLKHDLKNKKISLFVHNYKDNTECNKIYFDLLKQFNNTNIKIHNIDQVPNLSSLSEIESVDPWLQIYKKINSTF